jgi:hypothetical protein
LKSRLLVKVWTLPPYLQGADRSLSRLFSQYSHLPHPLEGILTPQSQSGSNLKGGEEGSLRNIHQLRYYSRWMAG